jgi:hypothetical protein
MLEAGINRADFLKSERQLAEAVIRRPPHCSQTSALHSIT